MPIPAAMPEQRAAAPAAPASTPAHLRELAERDTYQREREHIERRRQLRGLLVLVILVIAASIARSGVARVFPQGWWRIW